MRARFAGRLILSKPTHPISTYARPPFSRVSRQRCAIEAGRMRFGISMASDAQHPERGEEVQHSGQLSRIKNQPPTVAMPVPKYVTEKIVDAPCHGPQHSQDSSRSAPATVPEARGILWDHQDADFTLRPFGQPYSLPNPEAWASVAKWKWKNALRRRSLSSLRPSNWFADRATRPLLLTFDAFDTLFTPREPIAKQYCDVAHEWGLDFTEEDVQDSFKRAFKNMSKNYPNYGKDKEMPYMTWWLRLIHNTLAPLLPGPSPKELPRDFAITLYNRFSSNEGYTLFPDVLPFLSLLGSSSFAAGVWPPRRTMLGILSNSDPRVRDIFASFGISITPSLFPPRFTPHTRRRVRTADFGPANFAFATLSYDAGVAKPDIGIWDQAVRDAQMTLDEMHPVARMTRTGNEVLGDVREEFHCMHVGDDLEKDVLPALECGWDAILLDRTATVAVGTRKVRGELGEPREITFINNLMALRELVTKERLGSNENGSQKPVWINKEGKGPIERKRVFGMELKGRKIVEHPLSQPRQTLITLQ